MTDIIADRYELGRELGAGGMARVVAARDRVLGREVAVKLLHRDVLAQAGGRERFLHEARSAASFSHPSAVAIFDTGTDEDVPYIVMELVEGPTLAEVLTERGALTPPEATAVASQLLAALGTAHRRGLVHRDIKPANVLIPGGRVPTSAADEPPAKLADFGIAKGIEQAQVGLTATGQVLGTPKYVSPEQVGGEPATARSDVYSMGIVLYEMLAGAPPFDAESPLALAFAHRSDPPPRLDRRVRGIDRGLAKVVHRALAKDPRERFADGDEFRQALADPRRVAAAAPAPTAVMDPATARTEAPPGPAGTDASDEPGGRTPWRPIVLVVVLALIALAAVAVDWAGLVDELAGPGDPEDSEQPEEEADPDPEADEGGAGPPDDEPPPEEAPPEEAPAGEEETPPGGDAPAGESGDAPPEPDIDLGAVPTRPA